MINCKKIIIQIVSFTVCLSAIAAPDKQPVKNQGVSTKKIPAGQGKKQTVVRKKALVKKKNSAKKFAKRIYRSRLVQAAAVTGVLAGGFVLLCQQGLVPGFEVWPRDWSQFWKSASQLGNTLLNGSNSAVEEKKEKTVEKELSDEDRKRKNIEDMKAAGFDPYLDGEDTAVPQGLFEQIGGGAKKSLTDPVLWIFIVGTEVVGGVVFKILSNLQGG